MNNDFIIDQDGITIEDFQDGLREFIDGKEDDCVDVSGIKKYNLTEVEGVCLIAYTGSSSKWINQALRNDSINLNNDQLKFISQIDSALHKIPPHNGNIVYRMAEEHYSNYKIGQLFTLKSYLSTSVEIYDDADVVWSITLKSKETLARNIETITGMKNEKEVLFCRNSSFRVDDLSTENGVRTLHLSEL